MSQRRPHTEPAVLLPWRQSLVVWSAIIAFGLGGVAVALVVVPSGHIGWRATAALVLVAVAIDSADFAVLAMRGPAVRIDLDGIEFFGMGVLPWSAVRSSSLIIEEESGETSLVIVSNDSERWMSRSRWARPRSRRYIKRGQVSISLNVLQASPAQVVDAFERCGQHLRS
jgi:hypothetical protein